MYANKAYEEYRRSPMKHTTVVRPLPNAWRKYHRPSKPNLFLTVILMSSTSAYLNTNGRNATLNALLSQRRTTDLQSLIRRKSRRVRHQFSALGFLTDHLTSTRLIWSWPLSYMLVVFNWGWWYWSGHQEAHRCVFQPVWWGLPQDLQQNSLH